MRRSLALSLLVLVFTAGSAFSQEAARVTGKVTDADTKEPIAGVVIKVEATAGKTFKQDFNGKKDGTYAIFLLTGTLPYKFVYTAPGYQPRAEAMKLKLGEPNVRDIELRKEGAGGGTAMVATPAEAAAKTEDPAAKAYNEGAVLANNKQYEEAIVKFEEALKLNPDLTAGWMALAQTAVGAKKYPRAIEAANKALEIDNEDVAMWSVLYTAYTATGDKEKAKEAQAKMPANANVLFNDAARAINAGKDSEAESLLKQAVAADASFAAAWYELGMVYVRTGKNSDAKTALQKYLELEPTGKDAATAKEMLNYVK